MKPVDQIINLLKNDPENWRTCWVTINHKSGISIWTNTVILPEIYNPKRKISILDKIRLKLAINRWYRRPLTIET